MLMLVSSTILVVKKSTIITSGLAHGKEKGQAALASELTRTPLFAPSMPLGLWSL
jgi:hypothetical protein